MKRTNKNAGFSLIELLVVIAIMAILAGVGVAGYSVYTKEADKAYDTNLLGEINRAFAAACAEKGILITELDASKVQIPVTDKVANIAGMKPTDCSPSMVAALGETVTFKTFAGIYFDATSHSFKQLSDVYAGLVGSFDPDLIDKVNGSSFMTAEGLGVENLMGKVDYITNLAAGLADQTANNGAWKMLSNYTPKMLADLGIVVPENFEDLGEEEQASIMAPLYQMVGDKIAVLDTQNIDGWDEMDDTEKSLYAQNMILGNYAVLDAAKGMKDKTPAEVLTTIKGTTDFKSLILNSEDEDGVAQASAAYGLYTAYAYTIEDPTKRAAAIAKVNDPVNLLGAMNDPDFQDYLNTPEAETDLAGYMAAMQMIDASASNEDATYSLMINGFTDPALLAVIQQATSK